MLKMPDTTKPFIVMTDASCCTRSARHGTLFPFLVLTLNLRLRADSRCRAVQARMCCKRCGHVFSLGPYLLSMTSSPSALVAVTGFSSFHFRFAPSDKRAFCHSSLVTLYLAPLSPLDDNGSIAWSVRVLVQYIKPKYMPGKLQSSLLGYFPGLYETATGDTDAPSCHSRAARSLLQLSSLSPHPAPAPAVFIDSQLHHLNSTTLPSPAICGALDTIVLLVTGLHPSQ